jgi:hypothetical protein
MIFNPVPFFAWIYTRIRKAFTGDPNGITRDNCFSYKIEYITGLFQGESGRCPSMD